MIRHAGNLVATPQVTVRFGQYGAVQRKVRFIKAADCEVDKAARATAEEEIAAAVVAEPALTDRRCLVAP